MLDKATIKSWLDDCKKNARIQGARDIDIMKALMESMTELVNDISIDCDIKEGLWKE